MVDIILNINDLSKLDDLINLFYHLNTPKKLQLIEDLKKLRTEAAGRFLVAVYPREEDRKIQKAIRKALFVLRTVGIKVGELPAPPEGPVLRKVEQEKTHQGFMSNFDSEGTRLILAVMEKKRNSFVVTEAISHLHQGLVELMNLPATGTEVEKILAEYRTKTTTSIILSEISLKYALYLLVEEAGRSGRFTEEAQQLRQFSVSLKGDVQQPVDILSLAVPEETQPLDITTIMGSNIFEPLDLTWDRIDEDRKAFHDIGTGALVLPPYMVEEKKDGFVASFLWTGKGRRLEARIRRLMEDYAYIFYSERNYGAFRGLAEVLHQPEALLKTVSFLIRRTLEKSEAKIPGLIVNPYEQPVRP